MTPRSRLLLLWVALSSLLLGGAVAVEPRRVCADPDDLPFTNSAPGDKGLHRAGLPAARLGARVVPVKRLALRGQAAAGVRADDERLRERRDHDLAALGREIAMLADRYHLPTDPSVDLDAGAAAPVETPAPPPPPAPPPANQHRVNPYHGDPAALAEGRTQFNVHCSHCHSPNAASPDPVRDLRRLHQRYGERVNDVFYETVTKGRPTKGMPVWGPVLDEETIWKIKTFLESVQTKPEQ